MTFLNNNNNNHNHPITTTTKTVLPDFQYLTSSSDEHPILTTSYIPVHSLPKSVDVNQYGNNITNNTTHVNREILKNEINLSSLLGYTIFTYTDE